MGRTSYMIFPSHGSISRRLTGETNSSSTTLHMDTSCGYPMANWQGHETHPTGHKTSEVIGVVMTLMDLITLHPCPSSILMTYWGEPSSYLWMRMGRERGLPFLSMSRISVNNKSQEKMSSDSSSRLMETNLMTSFHITNLWNT